MVRYWPYREADEAQSQALEIAYDPEGLFPDVDETGASFLLDKNEKKREMQLEQAKEDEQREEYEKARAELEAAREARVQPTTHAELVTYFFETEYNEMEYEIVRQRPLLTDDFFGYLAKARDEEDDEAEKGKLEALYTVTSDFVGFVDQTTRAMLSPVEVGLPPDHAPASPFFDRIESIVSLSSFDDQSLGSTLR